MARGRSLRSFHAIGRLEYLRHRLTFVAVCTAWVFFRAPDLASALAILDGMYGGNGVALPDALARHLAPVQPLLAAMNVSFYLGGGTAFIDSWTLDHASPRCWRLPVRIPSRSCACVEPALDAKPAGSYLRLAADAPLGGGDCRAGAGQHAVLEPAGRIPVFSILGGGDEHHLPRLPALSAGPVRLPGPRRIGHHRRWS